MIEDRRRQESHSLFELSPRLTLLPTVHGSLDFAQTIRDRLLASRVDCLAVPLPNSWVETVVGAVTDLPAPSVVLSRSTSESGKSYASFVPVDPCQPVIAAIRWAMASRIPIHGIERESADYQPVYLSLPDPYALRGLSVEQFTTALLPFLPRPAKESEQDRRCRQAAFELHRLELDYENVVAISSMIDLPWIREAYRERLDYPGHDEPTPLERYRVASESLYFLFDELPFVVGLFERARRTLDSTESLSIDAMKELLLVARERWSLSRAESTLWLTPKLLQTYLIYVRNLTLVDRRLSPDLYSLVVAAKQVAGDRFGWAVLDTARDYGIEFANLEELPPLMMGWQEAVLPEHGLMPMRSRLPGVPRVWRSCKLVPEPPPKPKVPKEGFTWNPFLQCSWPPEDARIESFHTHVRQQARNMLSSDLARTEKFTTSIKDGIDMRETLRHWHQGDLYVKEIPPVRGQIEVVIFLFDVPADPAVYPWRTTWLSEHGEESTIGLFATDYRQEIIGPNIGRARYGGIFFIFPPRPIPDIWTDPRILIDADPEEGLEDRLLRAALFHSQQRHVAVVSPVPIQTRWRRLARKFGKKLVHLPLSRFSSRTIDAVRTVHVLGGQEIRSYASRFILGGE
jgi:hypothetical protein